MRTVKQIHNAVDDPIRDLTTFRALPTSSINHIDPFLFLNHHGYQTYEPNNNGLPFGPHPHKGFETVTFILKGDLTHKDSGGGNSVIKAGGVQWMTAGSGLVHAEVSSEEFKKKGGELEILQLWVNLPAKHKSVDPNYTGKQKEDIPLKEVNENILIECVSGEWKGTTGAFKPLNEISLAVLRIEESDSIEFTIPEEENIFFYVVNGSVKVNGEQATKHQLVEFENDSTEIQITADPSAIILFGHAEPFNEPIVAQGPFVMNSQEEIQEAYAEYRAGKFD